MRDWNYRHHRKCRGGKCRTGIFGTKLQGVENAGPSSYGKPEHVVVEAHRKSSVQLFVGINNVAFHISCLDVSLILVLFLVLYYAIVF